MFLSPTSRLDLQLQYQMQHHKSGQLQTRMKSWHGPTGKGMDPTIPALTQHVEEDLVQPMARLIAESAAGFSVTSIPCTKWSSRDQRSMNQYVAFGVGCAKHVISQEMATMTGMVSSIVPVAAAKFREYTKKRKVSSKISPRTLKLSAVRPLIKLSWKCLDLKNVSRSSHSFWQILHLSQAPTMAGYSGRSLGLETNENSLSSRLWHGKMMQVSRAALSVSRSSRPIPSDVIIAGFAGGWFAVIPSLIVRRKSAWM